MTNPNQTSLNEVVPEDTKYQEGGNSAVINAVLETPPVGSVRRPELNNGRSELGKNQEDLRPNVQKIDE